MGNDVKVKFTASTTGIEKGIGRVKSLVGGLGKTIGLVMAPLAALGGAAAFGAGIKDVLDYGGKVSDFANRTGLLASEIVVLEEALRQAGLEGVDTATVLQKLSKNIFVGMQDEGSKVSAWMNQFGISLKEIQGLSMAQQFELISSKIGALATDSQKAAAASDLFGAKQGLLLVNLFKTSTAMKDARETVGGLAGSMDKWASSFDYISDMIGAIGIKVRQFFAAFVGNNLGDLTKLADIIKSLDLTNVGASMGGIIAKISNAFKNGTFWSTIWNGLLYVLQKAGEYMLSIGELVGQKIGQAIEPYIPESMRPDTPPSGSSWEFLKYKYNGLLGSKDSADALAWNTRDTPTEDPFASEITNAASNLREKLKSGNIFKEFSEPLQWTLDLKLNELKSDKPVSSYQPQGFKAVADSLTRIGGGGLSMTANPLVSLQTKANNYLSTIARNTLQQPSSVWQ